MTFIEETLKEFEVLFGYASKEELKAFLTQKLTEQIERDYQEIKNMITDPTKHTWVDIEGMALIKEIASELDTIITKLRGNL